MTPKTLASLRRKVDQADNKILTALMERAAVVSDIGRLKNQRGDPVLVAGRERDLVNRLLALNTSPLPAESVEDIFNTIINHFRLLQKQITVAYFGPEASYTHQAAVKHFGKACALVGEKSIADVFATVDSGRADYGVVPIENSTEGVVNHTLDMFMESDLRICAERQDFISHCLLRAPGSSKKITSVLSHPQALAQCRQWLESHMTGVPLIPTASTSDAAAQAALHDDVAAVASPLAASLYHLSTMAQAIQDIKENRTRFLIVGKTLSAPSSKGQDKTSLLISVQDRVGALHDLLAVFKKARVNLTKIESRPTKQKAWQYVFFIDILGHAQDPRLQPVLKKLAASCPMVKILGSYPKADE